MEFLHLISANIDHYLTSPLILELVEQVLTLLEDMDEEFPSDVVALTVPIFLKCLVSQTSDQPNEDYYVDKAALAGLVLLVGGAQFSLYPFVEPFITANLRNTDWRYKDASITAFGAIIASKWQHPQSEDLIHRVLPIVLLSLRESIHPVMRISSAWAIGQIFIAKANLPHFNIAPFLSPISATLSLALSDISSPVQEQVSSAISEITVCAQDQPEEFTQILTRDLVFPLLQRIFELTNPAGNQEFHSSREMIFLAAASLIQLIPPTSPNELILLLVEIMRRFEIAFTESSNTEILSLCPLLFALLTALPEDLLTQSCVDALVNILLRICSDSPPEAQCEGYFAFGKLVVLCPDAFQRHATTTLALIQQHLDSTTTTTPELLQFLGDVSRALNGNLIPFVDTLIPRLFLIFRNRLSHFFHISLQPDLLP
jgi:hypothetical protein